MEDHQKFTQSQQGIQRHSDQEETIYAQPINVSGVYESRNLAGQSSDASQRWGSSELCPLQSNRRNVQFDQLLSNGYLRMAIRSENEYVQRVNHQGRRNDFIGKVQYSRRSLCRVRQDQNRTPRRTHQNNERKGKK